MNIPCKSRINCGAGAGTIVDNGTDDPISNLSSEAPDRQVFLGEVGGVWPLLPNLGSNWTVDSCLGQCVSDISAEDALLCAAKNAVICMATDNWDTPPSQPPVSPPDSPNAPTTPTKLFPSTAQFCTAECPDGTSFIYVVAPGAFLGLTQAMADLMANSFACAQVTKSRVCLGIIPQPECCLNFLASTTIAANALNPVTFSVVSGSLPPGLALTAIGPLTARLAGVATAAGDFTFRIQARDAFGNFMQKSYTFSVIEISTASPLPGGQAGVDYNVAFDTNGTTQGLTTWTVIDGTLPDGLTLNGTTGVLSGQPTTGGTFNFTVEVSDDFVSCSKQFTVTVQAVNCGELPASKGSISIPQLQGTISATPSGILMMGLNQSLPVPWTGVFALYDRTSGTPIAASVFSSDTLTNFSDYDSSSHEVIGLGETSTVFPGTYRIFAAALTSVAVTGTASNDRITLPSPLFALNDRVVFTTGSGPMPGNISTGTVYYVKAIFGSEITLSTTIGGPTVDITSDGFATLTYYKLTSILWPYQTTNPGSAVRCDDHGNAFVSGGFDVVVFDTATHAITQHVNLDPLMTGFRNALSMDINPATGDLYVLIGDGNTGQYLLEWYNKTLTLQASNVLAWAFAFGGSLLAAYSPDSGFAYISEELTANLHVVNPLTGATVQTLVLPDLVTGPGRYDRKNHQVYVALQNGNTCIICADSNTIIGQIALIPNSGLSYDNTFKQMCGGVTPAFDTTVQKVSA